MENKMPGIILKNFIKKDYYIGIAPFCDGEPKDCDLPVYNIIKFKGICT